MRKQEKPTPRIYTQEEAQEMISMIDGAYEIVELHGYRMREITPYSVK